MAKKRTVSSASRIIKRVINALGKQNVLKLAIGKSKRRKKR